jgi:hypothetical protein
MQTVALLASRTDQSIFEELIETGIVLPTRPVGQTDFLGDHQYLSDILRMMRREAMPSLLDCQQAVLLQIVFPLCNSIDNASTLISIEF